MRGWSRREAIGGFAAAGLILASPARAARHAACSVELSPVLDGIAQEILSHSPETATYAGLVETLEGGALARRMDDYSPAGELSWRQALQRGVRQLDMISCIGASTESDDLAIARAVLENGTGSAAIAYGRINPFGFAAHAPYLVTQVGGPHIDTLAIMETQQSLRTPEEIDAWCEKLESFGNGFRLVEEKLAHDFSLGCRPPRVLLEGAIAVADAFATVRASDHPLLERFRLRLSSAWIADDIFQRAMKRCARAIDHVARPAMARLSRRLRALADQAREEAGVWAQPDGDALYAANMQALGDTHLPAADVHLLGLEEVRRITAEMDGSLRHLGYSSGSVGERMNGLARDARFRFADNDDGRSALMHELHDILARLTNLTPRILPGEWRTLPAIDVRIEPPQTAAGAPTSFYEGPALDSSRPAIFWLNLHDLDALPRFRLTTLACHEAIPGHHLQTAVALGRGEAPLLARLGSFNAYQEGWALYAERLAAELGIYRQDPFSNLGRLQEELARAARLVIDTGLHHHRWSREQAIARLSAMTGMGLPQARSEVERYMAWPGQALGYKLGQLRLLAMRDAMRDRLGKRFDLRQFHRHVLETGPAPLDLVERRLNTA